MDGMGTMGKVRKSHPVGRTGQTGTSSGQPGEDTTLDHVALSAYVQRFSQAKVLVIGDLILDHYVWGRVSRISPFLSAPKS